MDFKSLPRYGGEEGREPPARCDDERHPPLVVPFWAMLSLGALSLPVLVFASLIIGYAVVVLLATILG